MVQSGKFWPCKHEDLSLIPKIHVYSFVLFFKARHGNMYVLPKTGNIEMTNKTLGSLTSQLSTFGGFQDNEQLCLKKQEGDLKVLAW